MTTSTSNSRNNPSRDRTRPTGWPVGSFQTYEEAQRAVDGLSDREFRVEDLTIVGVDLMQVENVTGRLTWPRILGGGALSGAWLGIFIGLIFALFALPGTGWGIFLWSIIIGAIFGLIFAAVGYALSGGKRDFSSMTTIVAGRYDVLCDANTAPQARDLIAQMNIAPKEATE
ncbi:magnesium transporter [Corynebacterium qintianiae]|uniref:Magnesium transporter n=1 Tax=Corynebacterium qintianiae TaxID=2709392 RepID=A0A7T0KNI8_9CORY|nr:general stress protein [Corynebacterium qintianiae]QPK83978.1 magnesium transporter [Corynebacterium qintianiae]